jgi:lysophospholipase L1-like esterase
MKSARLIGAILTALAGPALAQADMPALSAVCEAPAADIATPAPLPRLRQRLDDQQTLRILAIGSSSTWGVGASSPRRSYPAQLQTILQTAFSGSRAVIINRGVSGEVAQATAERLHTEVALERPDIVLWQVGTNDALARVPIEDFERTVSSTIEWLRQNNIETAIVGLQYTPKFARDEHYVAIREALRRVAAAKDVPYIRRYDAMMFIARASGRPEMMSGDELHLNDAGYQCMAEHVARGVIASLRMPRRASQR